MGRKQGHLSYGVGEEAETSSCPSQHSPGLRPTKMLVQEVTALVFIAANSFSRPFALCTDGWACSFDGAQP